MFNVQNGKGEGLLGEGVEGRREDEKHSTEEGKTEGRDARRTQMN